MHSIEEGPTSQQEKKEEELKVRDFGFNLEELLGKGWQEQVEEVENRDNYSISAVKDPDLHITSVELKDGRVVTMMSAKVKSGMPLEQMESSGGHDFRETESWLYFYNPKEKIATIISPDGQRTEIEASKEDFDAQIKKFRGMFADGSMPIAASGRSSTKEQEKK